MRLMVALDLRTEGHHWLLEQAGRVARLCGGTLDLLFVQTDEESDQAKTKAYEQRLNEMMLLVPAEHRGEVVVITGPLIDALTDVSRSYEGMVVGPREPGALERLLMGTIATRVMRLAQCPVVIPRHVGQKASEKPKLLVGVDVERDSFRWLIEQAGDWARAMGGVLDAVYMASNPAIAGIRNAYVREAALQEWTVAQQPIQAQIVEAMEAVESSHRGEAKVLAGDAENDLVALSEEYDFIVVGNLEHSGLRGYLLGTVASHVVRHAKCDVITLPAAAYLLQMEATRKA
jgi:nucleotide-binding universal stress UspA family protein